MYLGGGPLVPGQECCFPYGYAEQGIFVPGLERGRPCSSAGACLRIAAENWRSPDSMFDLLPQRAGRWNQSADVLELRCRGGDGTGAARTAADAARYRVGAWPAPKGAHGAAQDRHRHSILRIQDRSHARVGDTASGRCRASLRACTFAGNCSWIAPPCTAAQRGPTARRDIGSQNGSPVAAAGTPGRLTSQIRAGS